MIRTICESIRPIAPYVRKFGRALCLVFVAACSCRTPAASQGTGYWHTKGSQIVDANGVVVRIGGINWYGFETTDEVAHGLYSQDYHQILSAIHAEGYNTIRMPFSNQMVEHPIIPAGVGTENSAGPINEDLAGLNSLQVMDKIIAAAGTLGLKVILVNHRSEAGNSNEPSGLWYSVAYPESKWIADWQALANRYKSVTDSKGNPIVIGVDLRNEPHLLDGQARTGACWTGDSWTNGCPTTSTAQNWPAAAERAGNAVLSINPNLLIAVEGTDCYSGDCGWQGGNLEGAAKYPVQLSVANRLVYSAHDYGPDLNKQNWFSSSTTRNTLYTTWTKYWAYLSIDNTAPVWLGEFGTTNVNTDIESNTNGSQGQWFATLTSFLANNPNIHWTYWALNGEDEFGLLDNGYDPIPASATKQQLLSAIQFHLNEGTSGPTPTCSATAPVPTGLAATASSNSAQLSWNAVTSPANCALTYSIFRGTQSNFTAASTNQVAAGLTSATYTDSNLTAATTYYYRVESVDAHGVSAASTQIAIKTPAQTSTSGACHVTYTVTGQWATGFQASISIQNTGKANLSSWTLQWTFANNQAITSFWNGTETQSGKSVTVKSESYNGTIPAGSTVTGMGFTANATTPNTAPTNFTVNGVTCK
jgi:endoglucanase